MSGDDDVRRRSTHRMVDLLQEMLVIVRDQHDQNNNRPNNVSDPPGPGHRPMPRLPRPMPAAAGTPAMPANNGSARPGSANIRPMPAAAGTPAMPANNGSARPGPGSANINRRQPPAAAATLASSSSTAAAVAPEADGYEDFDLRSSSTPRYASALAEHRALFQPYSTRRPGRRLNSNINSQQSRAKGTVTPSPIEKVTKRWFLCMHTTDASTVPSTSLKSKLFDFGLGERLVSFGQNDDAAAVKQSLLSAFPKLEQAGGFEILKVREGTRTVLEVIQVGSFPAAKLRSFGSSASSKLYLRPLQNDIPLEEGSSEDFEYCTECGECFPVMELRQHKEECLKIDPMLLEAPYVCNTPDQQQQPNQEELPVQRQQRLSSDVLTASIISIIESIQGEEGAKEVLASYCKGFLEGRRLDVDNDRQSRMDGDVEEIFIDRSDIFKSAFSELMRASVNRRLTLKVNMFGEQVDDLGGPRREVLTILHRHVGEHFFKDGTLVSNETFVSQRKFEFAGVICALCLLQGGPPPKFFRQDILKEVTLVGARGSAGDEMKQFINGLDLYGVVKLMDAKPEVRVFFNKDVDKVPPLTVPGLLHLFAPITYAPNGSNKREKQKASMQSFTKWLRAVDEGKRFFIKPGGARDQERPPMALGDVLRFITGCENIPLFGLMPTPTLIFMVRKPTAFFATVSTCINMLRLPIEENALILLTDEDWFKAFDISFSSEDFQKEIFD